MSKKFLFGLFFVALFLRLIPVVATRHLGIGLDDMFQYDMLARSLASGNGYRWYAEEDLSLIRQYVEMDFSGLDYDPRGVLTSFRPPLYPAFLALLYLLFGMGASRFLVVRVVQAVMGAALAPMTWSLSRRVFPQRPRAARLAAWAVALYPMLLLYPLALATENLFFFLFLGALLFLLRADETRRPREFVLAGILFGLTALTRSVSLLAVAAAALWIWFSLRERKHAAIFALSVALVISPWILRNTFLHGRLSGIETSLGYSLYQGYHPKSEGTFSAEISLDLFPILDDAVRDQKGIEAALSFIREDPSRVPYLILRRLGFFFGLERRALTYFYSNNFFGYLPFGVLLAVSLLLLLPFPLLTLSMFFGMAVSSWTRGARLLLFVSLGYLFPHLLILAEPRFHMTLIPIFAVFAAQFWTSGFAAFRLRWEIPSGRRALLFAALGAVLLLANISAELILDAETIRALFGPNGNETYFPY
jgi:hypothetical protein